MDGFIKASTELQDAGQNSLPHWKQGFGYQWLSKKKKIV